jgi:hypothetical protein
VLSGGGANLTSSSGTQDNRLAIEKSFPTSTTVWTVTGVVTVALTAGNTASATAYAFCVNP